jgi:hypothetical protein
MWPDSTDMGDVAGYFTDPGYGTMYGQPVADTMNALVNRGSDDAYKYLEYLQSVGANPVAGGQGKKDYPYSENFYKGLLHVAPQDSTKMVKAMGGSVPEAVGTGRIMDKTNNQGSNKNGINMNKERILTEYSTGGTHETNKYGGIQIGGKAKVEEGEFRFDDPDSGESYVFSNRF